MKKSFLLIAISFCFNYYVAQTKYSKEVEEQIKKVENSLGGWAEIEGQPRFNILDRMAFFNVKGVSIAVIHDYNIVWAKGYGWADEEKRIPVTEKTLFPAGSMSKSINGMAILKL